MNDFNEPPNDPVGTVGLFPLPNLVLFPQALQPLHIFEPRYREMTADALAGDRQIALVLLQPGWEKTYEKMPLIHTVACLGRIVADHLLEDGRSNLLLRGISRVRILEELPQTKLYREARVEVITDLCTATLDTVMDLRRQLEAKIVPRFEDGPVIKQLAELFHSEMSLGALCDVLTFALPVPIEWKQMMLEERDEEVRAGMLMEGFDMIAGTKVAIVGGNESRKFPPDFSPN